MSIKLSLEDQKLTLLEVLNERTGRKFRVLPVMGMKKLLETFSLDEIDLALETLMRDQWHKDKVKELSAEYLLRATTVDKWLQKGEALSKPNQLNTEKLITL